MVVVARDLSNRSVCLFSNVKTVDDVDPYRVLFWLRDLEKRG